MKKLIGLMVVMGLVMGFTAEAKKAPSLTVKCKNDVMYEGEHDLLCEGLKGDMLTCCGCIVAKGHCAYEPHGGGGVSEVGKCDVEKMVEMMRPKTNKEIVQAIRDIRAHIVAQSKISEIKDSDAVLPENILNKVIREEISEVRAVPEEESSKGQRKDSRGGERGKSGNRQKHVSFGE